MSFELDFSDSFFFAEGEPYDRSDLAWNKSGNPVSVYSALCIFAEENEEDWDMMAQDLFDCPGCFLPVETVMDAVMETNTCTDLSSPVEVWIDPDGEWTIEVWEDR